MFLKGMKFKVIYENIVLFYGLKSELNIWKFLSCWHAQDNSNISPFLIRKYLASIDQAENSLTERKIW